jgi:DNA repair protein RecN (Recombination protein N)
MLEELRIQDFAIIDRLTLSFAHGFNVITGETGAGKSIIIDAVELLIGGKADGGAVRNGAERAIVEGTFALSERAQMLVLPVLEREGLADSPEDARFLTLTREVRTNGRSQGRINGVSVSSDVLREVGELLVDIHGQSTHLSLFKPRYHVDLLDRYADLLEVRSAFASVVNTLQTLRGDIKQLTDDKAQLARRAERLRDAVQEIASAKLDPKEEEGLLAERTRLANSEQLATLSAEIHALLKGDDRIEGKPIVDALMQVALLMSKLAKVDATLEPYNTQAQDLAEGAQDLALAMSNYADDIEYNPQRLDDIEERIELIKTLKKRYQCESIAALLAYAERAQSELEGIENSEERLEALRAQEEKTLRHLGELGERISRVREIAAKNMGKRIVRELADLRMENTRFEVKMERIESPDGCFGKDGKRYAFDASGIDKLEFLMSANVGEPLRPLAKVASGGEAARIMLAIKRVLAQADETPTLIFDEIDQGLGGRIGAVVGEKLWSLSQGHQVMCVTHLPQLATFGDKHYKVQKVQKDNRTATHISALEQDEQRVEELAQMMGATSDSGQQSARELLTSARTRKQTLGEG